MKPPKSAGVSDWKKYTPASHTADQTPPQSPKNKQTASACLIGHIWGFVAAATAVAALPCFSSAAAYRSPGGSDGIGLQCVGSHSTSTRELESWSWGMAALMPRSRDQIEITVVQAVKRRVDNPAAAVGVHIGNYRLIQPWQSAQRRG
jgi:hypothetical protein